MTKRKASRTPRVPKSPKVTKILFDQIFDIDHRLGPKEAQCLYWAAQGKSAEQTANLLRVSRATIETVRHRIKRKLRCHNLTHAVHRGIRCICGKAMRLRYL